MCAGPRFEYHWQDGVKYKRPTKMSAPGAFACAFWSLLCPETMALIYMESRRAGTDYVEHLMNWVQGMLDDEAIFPSKPGPSASPLLARTTR